MADSRRFGDPPIDSMSAAERVVHLLLEQSALRTDQRDVAAAALASILTDCLEQANNRGTTPFAHPASPILAESAAELAFAEVPLEVASHVFSTGFLSLLEQSGASTPNDRAGRTRPEDGYRSLAHRLIDIMYIVTRSLTAAYLEEVRTAGRPVATARRTRTPASTRAATPSVSKLDLPCDQRYVVLALDLARAPDSPSMANEEFATRRLTRIRTALVNCCDHSMRTWLSTSGGTVVLPADAYTDGAIDALVRELTETEESSVTAAVVAAIHYDVPEAAELAHRLLDVVGILDYPSGLYHLDDLAVEMQLARPGPARDRLAAIVVPLDEHPDLMALLRRHLHNNLDRRATAAHFGVHRNTVDHRLKRIEKLTGLNPTSGAGIWMLRSAMVAHGFHRAT